MFSMSSTGCLSSNQELVISAEMRGMKVNLKESGERGSWEKIQGSFYKPEGGLRTAFDVQFAFECLSGTSANPIPVLFLGFNQDSRKAERLPWPREKSKPSPNKQIIVKTKNIGEIRSFKLASLEAPSCLESVTDPGR